MYGFDSGFLNNSFGMRSGFIAPISNSDTGSSPAPGPTPPTTNLLAWYKADAGVIHSASKISSWADQSGNGYHLVQSIEAAKPTYSASIVDGMPTVDFDGVGDYLMNFDLGLWFQGEDKPLSMFWVSHTHTTGTNRGFAIISSTSSQFPYFWINAGGTVWQQQHRDNNLTQSLINAIGLIQTGVYQRCGAVYGGQSGYWRVTGSTYGSASANIGQRDTHGFYIGSLVRAAVPSNYWHGDIPEFLVYSEEPNSAKILEIEAYFRQRYPSAL